MKKRIIAAVAGILLSISMLTPVMAASSPTTRAVTQSITTPAQSKVWYSLNDAEKASVMTTPFEAMALASGFMIDSSIANGNPVLLSFMAADAGFVANVKAALLKDGAVKGSLGSYGIGGSPYIIKGSVLTGVNYSGDVTVSLSIPEAPADKEVAILVYRLGSKTPSVVKPSKLKDGKFAVTLPVPCSWYAVTGR